MREVHTCRTGGVIVLVGAASHAARSHDGRVVASMTYGDSLPKRVTSYVDAYGHHHPPHPLMHILGHLGATEEIHNSRTLRLARCSSLVLFSAHRSPLANRAAHAVSGEYLSMIF